MKKSIKEIVAAVLNSLQSKDKSIVLAYIDKNYIQHNLGAEDGRKGLLNLFDIPNVAFKVNIVRIFEDGDFVFTHTEYDFFGPKIGFDIFRFHNGKIAEHWDNLQEAETETVSGRSQTDGPTEAHDLTKTRKNKELVQSFVEDILLGKKPEKAAEYISTEKYDQHNPHVADGLQGLGEAIKQLAEAGMPMTYTRNYRILCEGDFALAQSEGQFMKKHVAFYDLFRIENGKIVEHWDTIEEIPEKEYWKNKNGKF